METNKIPYTPEQRLAAERLAAAVPKITLEDIVRRLESPAEAASMVGENSPQELHAVLEELGLAEELIPEALRGEMSDEELRNEYGWEYEADEEYRAGGWCDYCQSCAYDTCLRAARIIRDVIA